MKVKCYALFQGQKQLLSQYANNSQRNFLDFQLKNAVKRAKKNNRIEFQHTSNGVWYSKVNSKSNNTHLVLLSPQAASVSLAAQFIQFGEELQQQKSNPQKFRMKIADQIKTANANKKLDQVSSNVVQLQGIIKGNMSKLVTQIGDLDSVQRKSEMMTSLSLQFEKDSKQLQKKMKRKNCITKMAVGGGLSLLIIFVVYFMFIM